MFHFSELGQSIIIDRDREVFRLILRETKKMVEFDDVPTKYLKTLLDKYSNFHDTTEVELSEDQDYYHSIEELKLSSISLAEKVRVSQQLVTQTSSASEDAETEKKFKVSKSKKTYMTYEKTMDRVKLNFWNASLWKIQVRNLY